MSSSVSWRQQKRLSFDCFVDYITCIHFVAIPSNEQKRRVEAFYLGCNNGLVLVSDMSSLSSPSSSSTSTSIDTSSSLSLLYRHQNLSFSKLEELRKKRNLQQKEKEKAKGNEGEEEELEEGEDLLQKQKEQEVVADEEFGSTVFAISVYETIFATCSDDGRCVISLLDSHPPFSASSSSSSSSSSSKQQKQQSLDKLTKLPACCSQIPLLAVIELPSIPIRAVQLFGGKRDWASSLSKSSSKKSEREEEKENEEETTRVKNENESVYVAIGAEDGYFRVYRVHVNISSTSSPLLSFPNKNSNSWEENLGEGSQNARLNSERFDLLYVVQCSCAPSSSMLSSNSNSTTQQQQQPMPYICKIDFDEISERFIVGTSKGCLLVDCLPNLEDNLNNNEKEKQQQLQVEAVAGDVRDTDHRATVDEWLNAPVFVISESRLRSNQIELPPKSSKQKYWNLIQSSRKIGSVNDILSSSSSSSSQNTSESKFADFQVMFPGVKALLPLPQNAVRRVRNPLAVLAASGGPFFAVVSASSSAGSTSSSSSSLSSSRYVIAGAAASGEVCVIEVSNNNNSNKQQEAEVSEKSQAYGEIMRVICRFRAANDIIRHISLTPSSCEEFLLITCASFDGTISNWLILQDQEEEEKEERKEKASTSSSSLLFTAVRRGVLFLTSASSDDAAERTEKSKLPSPSSKNVKQQNQTLTDSLYKFPLLLGRNEEAENQEDDEQEQSRVLQQQEEEEDKKELVERMSSSGVSTLFQFPEAGVIFASCLFEKCVKSFLLMPQFGCELPQGMLFNGIKSVHVNVPPPAESSSSSSPSSPFSENASSSSSSVAAAASGSGERDEVSRLPPELEHERQRLLHGFS